MTRVIFFSVLSLHKRTPQSGSAVNPIFTFLCATEQVHSMVIVTPAAHHLPTKPHHVPLELCRGAGTNTEHVGEAPESLGTGEA